MAKTTASLQAPDTRFSRPTSPVQDTSVASAITGAGKAIATGVELKQSFDKQAAADAQLGRESALRTELTEFSDDVITAAAQKSLDGFQRDVNKFANLSETETKIRTEAILRKHVASDPANAQKYRTIAGSVLGFDPTGETLAAVFSQQEATANVNAQLKKQYLALGGDINTWGTPQSTEWFRRNSAFNAKLKEQTRELEFAKQTNQLSGLSAHKELRTWSKNSSGSANANALGMVQGVFNKPLTQITDKDIATVEPEVLQSLIQDITEQKFSTRQQATERFLGFGDISNTDIEDAVQTTTDQLDFILNRLSLNNTQQEAANRIKLNNSITEAGLWQDEKTKPFLTMQTFFPDVPLPIEANSVLFDAISPVLNGKIVDGIIAEEQEARKKGVTFYKAIIKGIGETGVLDDAQRENAAKFFRGLSRSSVATANDMSQSQKDGLMEVLQVPQLATMLQQIPESAGDAQNLSFIAQDYTFKTLLAASADLRRQFRLPAQFRTLGKQETNKVSNLVTLTTTPKGFKIVPKNRTEGARLTASLFNERYITRLNKSIRATANLDGESVESTMQALLNSEEFTEMEDITALMPVAGDEE